jgi:hypothetical protein
MQEQMTRAMAAAIGAGGDPAAAARPAGKMPGGRILAAMFKAREAACDCEPCRLLKAEVDTMLDGFLAEAATAFDEGPAEAQPVAVSGPVETPAVG